MSADSTPSRSSGWFLPLAILTAVAVITGTLARFWALGHWPLAIDEYYFEQSVQNVLHFGIPKFPCGGLYVRGLLLQYVTAALQLAGLSAELAPRLIAALSSLLTLPAAYQIARRFGGREVGLLTVTVLALSVWEIEIGRFGRMYSPFQALFAWYVVFFLRYVIDHNRRALGPMIVLSALGLGVWEGGIFLVLTNLLPPFIASPSGRLTGRDWLYLLACSLLLVPAYILTMADLRTAFSVPTLPPDYVEPPDTPSLSRLDAAVMPWRTLRLHLGWAGLAVLPAVLAVYAAVRQWRSQPSFLAWASVTFILGCAAMHQFQLAAGVAVIVVLLGIVPGSLLVSPSSQPMHLAFAGFLLFWIAFGLSTSDWHASGLPTAKVAFLLGYEFVRFPDTVRQIAMPWARTVPGLALGLFILNAACVIRACVRFDQTVVTERVLLAMFVLLLLAAGASNPPRHETRYVFFLYPLAIIFALLTLDRALRALRATALTARAALATACLALFALSEDFQPRHLWNIDTEAVNFRIGMGGRLSSHYHPRSDTRAAAEWLRAHVVAHQDIVIDSFPGVDFYYRDSDYYFVADSDDRFEVWSCARGTVQRWSNLPMLHTYDALAATVASGRRVWLVVETGEMTRTLAKLPSDKWTVAWTSHAGDISIVSFPVVGNGTASGT